MRLKDLDTGEFATTMNMITVRGDNEHRPVPIVTPAKTNKQLQSKVYLVVVEVNRICMKRSRAVMIVVMTTVN